MMDAPPDIMEKLQWMSPPAAGWGWDLWAFLLAWLIFLAAGVGYGIQRRRMGLTLFAPAPPHEAALRALRELRQKLSEENPREFAIEASHVVRRYIQARFGLRAPHRSTEEFLREIYQGDRLLRDHHDLLGSFLTDCDLVKFALRRVLREQMEQMIDSAHRFVEETIPSREASAMEAKSV